MVLEVDHVHPVAEGGTNHIDNLLTACFDCNRGKGAGLLTAIPDSVEQRTAVLQERQAQAKAYNKLLKEQRKQADQVLIRIEDVFCRYFPKAGRGGEVEGCAMNKLTSILYLCLALSPVCSRAATPESL